MSYEEKDPKTVEAIEKIKAILIEYDLWGAVTVISPERSHWLWHVDPSWSCLHINKETGECRFRAKVQDFATPEQHKKVIELTGGAIIETCKLAVDQANSFGTLLQALKKQLPDLKHTRVDVEYKNG